MEEAEKRKNEIKRAALVMEFSFFIIGKPVF